MVTMARTLRKLGRSVRGAVTAQLPVSAAGIQEIAAGSLAGKKVAMDKLWRNLFENPSQWVDNRHEKVNLKYPDFKHGETGDGLWVIHRLNPPWVKARLSAMAPGSLRVDLFTWNTRLARLVQTAEYEKALELFGQMLKEKVTPNNLTFMRALGACSGLRALAEGRRIHKLISQSGYKSDLSVGNAIVDMYAKCGSMEDARTEFDRMPSRDVVTWNTLIFGYSKCGRGRQALEVFQEMQSERACADPVTFLGVLNACAGAKALEEGRHVHCMIKERGFESDARVSNSLVNMYSKCESIADAQLVFERMRGRDVVAWNAMILGFARCGQGSRGLELWRQMCSERVIPDRFTFLAVLNACACVASLEEGRQVHAQIMKSSCKFDSFVCSSLIDMYAKCGSLEDALRVFRETASRDVVVWNAMIAGYSMHGNAQEALQHFEQMCQEGLHVDNATFGSLLSACSRAGLVNEGLHYFESIPTSFNLPAEAEHYSCVVDLLSRAGRLHEAEDLIKKMVPCESNEIMWTTLLSACRVYGNVEMGKRAARRVLELNPFNSHGYVLLGHICTGAGQRDTTININRQKLERQVKKSPGRSWIEVDGEMHSFTAEDLRHPRRVQVLEELDRLALQMGKKCQQPAASSQLPDVEMASSQLNASHHSERLAIAFGLISTSQGTPLRIFKNLRVCADCHAVIKVIAKMVKRVIIVRDAHRFHRFEDGFCSCRDYW